MVPTLLVRVVRYSFFADPEEAQRRKQRLEERFSKPPPRVEKGGRMTRHQMALKKEDTRIRRRKTLEKKKKQPQPSVQENAKPPSKAHNKKKSAPEKAVTPAPSPVKSQKTRKPAPARETSGTRRSTRYSNLVVVSFFVIENTLQGMKSVVSKVPFQMYVAISSVPFQRHKMVTSSVPL